MGCEQENCPLCHSLGPEVPAQSSLSPLLSVSWQLSYMQHAGVLVVLSGKKKEKAIYSIFLEMEVKGMFFLLDITISFCWLALFICPSCY